MLRWLYLWADRVRARARARLLDPDHAFGRDAEDIAHRFLERHGMTVVARNYRTRGGSAELDLVAREGDSLVFIEVKARRSDSHGAPERAIDPQKRDKIVSAARDYLRRSEHPPDRVRFDIVAISGGWNAVPRHYRDVWTLGNP